MPHYINRCKHGKMMGQCRCAAPNKVTTIVECPASCPTDSPIPGATVKQLVDLFFEQGVYVHYQPEHRVDAIYELAEHVLGLGTKES